MKTKSIAPETVRNEMHLTHYHKLVLLVLSKKKNNVYSPTLNKKSHYHKIDRNELRDCGSREKADFKNHLALYFHIMLRVAAVVEGHRIEGYANRVEVE